MLVIRNITESGLLLQAMLTLRTTAGRIGKTVSGRLEIPFFKVMLETLSIG